MILCIDFDGTCVTHEYPKIGKDIGAEDVLKELVKNGHQLILWTMRSGETLDIAVKWFEERSIPLFGINENPTQKTWTTSNKAYAHKYIDDAAMGAPLKEDIRGGLHRPYIDWDKLKELLINDGTINVSS